MLTRLIAVPVVAGLVTVALTFLLARRGPGRPASWKAAEERDPLGPTEGVVLALERTRSMKITTEAEALCAIDEDDV